MFTNLLKTKGLKEYEKANCSLFFQNISTKNDPFFTDWVFRPHLLGVSLQKHAVFIQNTLGFKQRLEFPI